MVSLKALQGELRLILYEQSNIREAQIIIEECLGLNPADMMIDSPVDDNVAYKARNMASRRSAGEPLQYIIGHWPFRNLELKVGPGVLIPRPETELITDIALDFLNEIDNPSFIDLCCGSGNIAISVNSESGIHGTAVDISPQALEYCRFNVAKYSSGIDIVESDIFDYYRNVPDSSVDLVISNPPYVSTEDYNVNKAELEDEPYIAFVPPDGDELGFYRQIINLYYHVLKPGGAFIFECGRGQANDILRLAENHVFTEKKVILDLADIDRFVMLRRHSLDK